MNQEAYLGFIANGRSGALVAPDLAVNWLCTPRVDGVPVLAAALDPERGGALRIGIAGGESLTPVSQQYTGRDAVLETVAESGHWRLTAHDVMPWMSGGLVRRLTVTARGDDGGAVPLQIALQPIQSELFPLTVTAEGGIVLAEGQGCALALAVRRANHTLVPLSGPDCVLHLQAGAAGVSVDLALGLGEDRGAALQALFDLLALADPVAETRTFWADWIAVGTALPAGVPADWAAAYWRSLITLKLLQHEPTGALVAAATASFPATPGGWENWDYRFTWLRDGSYTAAALDQAGFHGESRAFYRFALTLQGADGHWQQPLYTVDGGDPTEVLAPDLTGPRGERPIRFGNAASGQLQLDNEGNILDGIWRHLQATDDLAFAQEVYPLVANAADWLAANWHLRESGIWELREYTAHWVHGKAMCAAGLRAAAGIARLLGETAPAEGWEAEAEQVTAAAVGGGFDPQRGVYLAHWGGPQPGHLDISVLALAFCGLLPAADPRLLATAAAMEQPVPQGLAVHGGIGRYDWATEPFYLPTFWLARYFLLVGEREKARRYAEACLASATNLALMAEHFHVEDGRYEQWGNFPQAFSHLEVIRFVWAWCDGAVGRE